MNCWVPEGETENDFALPKAMQPTLTNSIIGKGKRQMNRIRDRPRPHHGAMHICRIAAMATVSISFALLSGARAGGEWPDGPNKSWFENLQRPDNDQNPRRDYKSRFCCGVADTVKTRFKVEPSTEKYPEDRWYAWIKDEWIPIPPEKIVKEYAPDGQAYLFMLAGTVQCFVRPKGGL